MDIKRDIKFIVVDLDGTLLNDEHTVSERNKTAIKQAMEQGINVVIATGKTRASAEAILKELELGTPGVFVQGLILYNADGTVRQEHALDAPTARKAIQYAESQAFEVIAYCGDRLVCQTLSNSVKEIARFGEPMPEAVGPLVNHVGSLKMHKLIVVGGNRRKLTALRWQLGQQIGNNVNFTDGGVLTSLEILPKGANKGQGVKTLLRQLGAKPEQVMGIGDAENDVEMLQAVGFAVAVANAADKTKAVADEIVASNNEDGVAEAIERFALKAADANKTDEATETPSKADETTAKGEDA